MAREKGTGNLQKEKSGRWTLRVGINGRRLSRSTGTRDRDKAEAFLNRFLAPLGLGATRLPLAEAWHHYEMSPNRRDLARSTLDSKRIVWMGFARWMEKNHLEIAHLAEVTEEAVAEYLAEFRCHHSASTYNGHVCVLREIFRVLADKAGITHDPWAGVCLRANDSISRRELTVDEVERLYTSAAKLGQEWKLLLMTGIYTGMRLGDCCRLKWEDVHLDRGVIQVIPEKTKKHAHGKPVTIPIHPSLMAELLERRSPLATRGEEGEMPCAYDAATRLHNRPLRGFATHGEANTPSEASAEHDGISPCLPSENDATLPQTNRAVAANGGVVGTLVCGKEPRVAQATCVQESPYVNPAIAELYLHKKWRLDEGLRKIFKAANITMSIRVEGRRRKTVVASFHSLRHTFVSFSANAGVPLPVVASIVGHCSTAMTRHYYHENLDALRSAVASIPVIGEWGMGNGERLVGRDVPIAPSKGRACRDRLVGSRIPRDREPSASSSPLTIPARLKRLDKYLSKGIVTQDEYAAARQRILAGM